MRNNPYIKKIIALLFVVIFAFSITPTIFFHNLFANHIDISTIVNNNKQKQLSKIHFYCHCNDIVAESPFLITPPTLVPTPESVFYFQHTETEIHFFSTNPTTLFLRGPPAI